MIRNITRGTMLKMFDRVIQPFCSGLIALFLTTSAQAEQIKYRFSPVNQWDITKTATYWNPIIDYVSTTSGVPLQLKIGRTSADTTSYVLAKEAEFVFSNHLFSPQRLALGWVVFGRRTDPAVRGQIVVPADSKIMTLAELNSQAVAFAGKEAFLGYKVPMEHFYSQGVAVRPIFSGNQNSAFSQLFSGRAMAAGSNSALVKGYSEKEAKEFRVLWESESYLDLALMAAPVVGNSEVQAVSTAFFTMHANDRGRRILETSARAVGLPPDTHFVPAKMADYENYVKFYERAPNFLH